MASENEALSPGHLSETCPTGVLRRAVRKVAVRMAAIPLALFAGAGSWNWWPGWVVSLLALSWMGFNLQWLLRHNRPLLIERVNASFCRSPFAWDRRILYALFLLGVVWLPLSAADAVRWQWSQVPLPLTLCGLAVLLLSLLVMTATLIHNRHLSPLVKAGEDPTQEVIQTGPYRFVRHPFYTGICGMGVGLPLALGSLLGLGIGGLIAGLVVWRTMLEDRLLYRALAGYAVYAQKVRWRLVPHVW